MRTTPETHIVLGRHVYLEFKVGAEVRPMTRLAQEKFGEGRLVVSSFKPPKLFCSRGRFGTVFLEGKTEGLSTDHFDYCRKLPEIDALRLLVDQFERQYICPFVYPSGIDSPGYFAGCQSLGWDPVIEPTPEMAPLDLLAPRRQILTVLWEEMDICARRYRWTSPAYVYAARTLGRKPACYPEKASE